MSRRIGRKLARVVAWGLLGALQLWASAPSRAANASVYYTYDALGRLSTASYDTGYCIIYTYDANGNRLSLTSVVSNGSGTGAWGSFNWDQAIWGNGSGVATWGCPNWNQARWGN